MLHIVRSVLFRGVAAWGLWAAWSSNDCDWFDDRLIRSDRGLALVICPDHCRHWKRLSAGLIAAMVLFRSPVLVLAQGVRPVVLRDLLSAGADAARHVRRARGVYAVAAVVLTAGAYVIGPALLRVSFGDAYVVSNTQAAGLALSAVVLAYAVHLSVALIALDHHRRGTEGWMVAVVATLFLLVLPLDGTDRLLLAAVAGPLLGVAYLNVAWVRVADRAEAKS